MDRKNIIIIAVAAVVAIGAYFVFGGAEETPMTPTTTSAPTTAPK